MIYSIYSVKDVVSGSFTDILPFSNEAMAIRYFKGLCSESKIKNDLQLYKLGTYNIETGDIVSSVEFIAGGSEYNE